MDEETAAKTRTMIRRVVISNFDDRGPSQTVRIESGAGIIRDQVEVLQPYGFATLPPEDGATGIVLAVGGDEGDPVVLPVTNAANRLGGLASGDTALYNQGGDKIVLRASGTLEIKIGSDAVLELPAGLTIKTSSMVVEAELLKCTGDIADKYGTMNKIREDYNQHSHGDSPPPSPKMI